MADFNPSTPTVRGMEWRPTTIRQYPTGGGGRALACRFRSPGAVTVSAVHQYLSSVTGAPGIGVEIVDTLVPAQTTQVVFPSTDTGRTVLNWDVGGAGTFADVAKNNNDATYWWTAVTADARMRFRAGAAALSGKRIVSVVIKARISGGDPATFGGAAGEAAWGGLQIGAIYYDGSAVPVIADQYFRTMTLATWGANPSTNLPWTQAQVNNIIGGTDSFGVDVFNNPGYIAVSGVWLEVTYVTENRKGFLYTLYAQVAGWTKQTLGSTSALSANTWYWLVIWGPFNIGTDFTIPILRDPNVVMAASASTAVGEHRQVSELTFNSFIGTATNVTAGEMFPFLLDVAGTIQSQSQPYAELDQTPLSGGGAVGQQITTAAGATSYGAVRLVVGWQDPNNRPDAPLTIDVRHGAGAATGGGTLDATGQIQTTDLAAGSLQTFQSLAVFTSPAGATQMVTYITSTATPGRGWVVASFDTRSDVVTTTTTAQVEGASQGGTTDALTLLGSGATRYDIPASLVVAPAAPAGFSATPRLAT